MNFYQSLMPIIERKGLLKDPKQFHSAVNIIFHKYESIFYDRIHEEMWKSLPIQFELIVSDLLKANNIKDNLKILDIGCGTGLATEMLISTTLGGKIDEIHLLDTSNEMLVKAKERSVKWCKKVSFFIGDISIIDDKYDLIIISSVLHHIPDIPKFLKDCSRLQCKDGVIITLHDPSFDSIESEVYKQRCKEYLEYKKNKSTQLKKSLFQRFLNKIFRLMKPVNYIGKINKELIKKKIIREPLSDQELWSVTDLHAEDLPHSANDGISKKLLENALEDYYLINYRTYGFFGSLFSNLEVIYQKKEIELIDNADLNGRNFSSIWRKKL